MEVKEVLLNLGVGISEQFAAIGGVDTSTIEYEVIEGDNGPLLRVEYPEYYRYVDRGRRAGSALPPVSAILEWGRENAIPIDRGGAFAIAKSIARDGIPARPFVDLSIEQALEFYDELIAEAYANTIENMIADNINNN